jgi:cullin 3
MAGRGRGRLVIEPFRTTMQTDPQFATKTWGVLENAIGEIFNANASHLSFEALYRASYNMVLHRHAELLYSNLRNVIEAHLATQAAEVAGKNDDEFLGALDKKWQAHKVAMQMIRDILMYLDRTHVEQNNKTSVYDAGLECFRDYVARHVQIKERLLKMMLDFIQQERDGERIDRQLARRIAGMYSDISHQLYQEDFEVPFLETSQQFYEKESQRYMQECTCADFLKKAEKRLEEEATRVEHYLDDRTGPKIRRKVQDTMILAHMQSLVDMENSGLVAMLRDDRHEDLHRMYRLFREVQGGAELIKSSMAAYLVSFGTELVQAPEKQKAPLEFIRCLLELKAKFDVILKEALSSKGEAGGMYDKTDKAFATAVNSAFEQFMNKNQRTPEFLSIYVDRQLKSELGGVAEDEADTILEKAMMLFKLLDDKDVFERYYKLHLAKRLLTKGTVSDDLEKSFVRIAAQRYAAQRCPAPALSACYAMQLFAMRAGAITLRKNRTVSRV